MRRSRTGRLNKKITLLYPKDTPKIKDGIEVPDYGDGGSVWVAFDVRPPKGQALKAVDDEHASLTRWVMIRYKPGITSKWKVKYVVGEIETLFEIVSPPIDEEMRHRILYLELKVVE